MGEQETWTGKPIKKKSLTGGSKKFQSKPSWEDGNILSHFRLEGLIACGWRGRNWRWGWICRFLVRVVMWMVLLSDLNSSCLTKQFLILKIKRSRDMKLDLRYKVYGEKSFVRELKIRCKRYFLCTHPPRWGEARLCSPEWVGSGKLSAVCQLQDEPVRHCRRDR